MRLALVLLRSQDRRLLPVVDAVVPGAAWYEAGLVAELRRQGHEVVVFSQTMRISPRNEEKAATSGTVDFRGGVHGTWGSSRFARWAGRRIRRGGFDASISLTTTVPATLVVPWEGTQRERGLRAAEAAPPELWPWVKMRLSHLNPGTLARLRLEQRTLADASVRRIVATNSYIRRQLLQLEGVTEQRLASVPISVPASSAGTDPQQRRLWRAQLRQRLRIAPQDTVYLFDSYRPQLDGLSSLLAAFLKVREVRPNSVLLLTGRTQWRHERELIQLGLRSQVRFLGQPRETQAVYAAADVTVQPTYFDPAGETVMQSLAMGVPAVTTRYSGATELLLGPGGERWGRVVAQPGDVAGLAEAMRDLPDGTKQRHAEAIAVPSGVSMAEHVQRLLEVLEAARYKGKEPQSSLRG